MTVEPQDVPHAQSADDDDPWTRDDPRWRSLGEHPPLPPVA